MLVLSRKLDETIVIDGSIRVKVVGIRGSHVRLGIEAPDRVGIYREELRLPSRVAGEHARAYLIETNVAEDDPTRTFGNA